MTNNPFTPHNQPPLHSERPESTGSIFSISDTELPVVIAEANAGDAVFSFKLYQYFKFSKSNLAESDAWLAKAAQQGHPTAKYNLAASLLRKNN